MKKVYVLLAKGFELIEALTPVAVLKRGGISVVTVSIYDSLEVASSNNVVIKADTTIDVENMKDGDLLILPGGYPGYENLSEDKKSVELLNYYFKNSKYIGAICGAPTILDKSSLLEGKEFTCHSAVLKSIRQGKHVDKKVVISDKIITSKGAGTSLDFSLELLRILSSDEVVEKVKGEMQI
ncbi:MAG: DJ-1 family glyoxalase III [Fusobacteriaceae bacterium]